MISCRLKHTGNMSFEARAREHTIVMDAKAPLGSDQGATPKELVLMGTAGCTAMDVAALLKKHKQVPTKLEVVAETELTPGHPSIFQKVELRFEVDGPVDAKILEDAVVASQTKYCGVSAMIARAAPVEYKIILNGTQVAQGKARFE